jgi:hypothetical protein
MEDISTIEATVREAAERSYRRLARETQRAEVSSGIALLQWLKFERIGHDPISGESTNLIEQVNQTFTILVALRAAAWLLEKHNDCAGIHARFGTSAGIDLESCKRHLFAAEVFAATHPRSNNKLRKDIDRLVLNASTFRHRYVFFHSPGQKTGPRPDLEVPGSNVNVISVTL